MILHCHLSEFWSIKQWHCVSPFLKHKDCEPFLLYPTTTWYMTLCYTNWLQQYRLKRSPGYRQLWGSDVAFFLLDSKLAHSLLSACVNNAPELPEQKLSQGEWNHPAGVRDASSDQDLLRISPPTYCCRPMKLNPNPWRSCWVFSFCTTWMLCCFSFKRGHIHRPSKHHRVYTLREPSGLTVLPVFVISKQSCKRLQWGGEHKTTAHICLFDNHV